MTKTGKQIRLKHLSNNNRLFIRHNEQDILGLRGVLLIKQETKQANLNKEKVIK